MGKARLQTVPAAAFATAMIAAVATADASATGPLAFRAVLTGAQEVPTVDSNATGSAFVQFDRGFTRAEVRVRVRGDIEIVAAHFHCARPGENGTIAFGLFNPGQLTEFGEEVRVRLTNADFTNLDCVPSIGRPVNNIAALAFAMQDGLIYINLHSPNALNGEIRGQLLPVIGID